MLLVHISSPQPVHRAVKACMLVTRSIKHVCLSLEELPAACVENPLTTCSHSESSVSDNQNLIAHQSRTVPKASKRPSHVYLFVLYTCFSLSGKVFHKDGGAWVSLQSAFSSAVDVGASAYPFLPVRLLMKDRFDNIERAKQLPKNLPVCCVHGDADEICPVNMGRSLFEALPSTRRSWR